MRMYREREYQKVVLVVEDEICCAESLQLLLQFYGCKVLLANSCEEGLALLRKNQKRIERWYQKIGQVVKDKNCYT